MTILDRQRYWAYIKAYVICFTSMTSLYVIIDAFTNLDEFTKINDTPAKLAAFMSRYYAIRTSAIYDRLCGVIGMMAAIFTVTWVQRNNELLAMLAAGISARRVIRPVMISGALVSTLAVANQELILPRFANELQKYPDDDGRQLVRVYGRYDANRVYLHSSGPFADREQNTIANMYVTFPVTLFGVTGEMSSRMAYYVPPDHPTAPLKGGWLLRSAKMTPTTLTGTEPVLVKLDPKKLEGFPPPKNASEEVGEVYFLQSSATFYTLIRKPSEWYQFAATPELIAALNDPSNEHEKKDIAIFLHQRNLRPGLAFALMALSMPLVLGGFSRNTYLNLGFSVATSAAFYASLFACQYLAGHGVFPAEMSAWIPMIGFGTLAVARWDKIKT
jgi:lipopolysaccharide export system permease protein